MQVKSFIYGEKVGEPTPRKINSSTSIWQRMEKLIFASKHNVGIVIRDIEVSSELTGSAKSDFIVLATDDALPENTNFLLKRTHITHQDRKLEDMLNPKGFMRPGLHLAVELNTSIQHETPLLEIYNNWRDSKKKLLVIKAHGGSNPWYLGQKFGTHKTTPEEIIEKGTEITIAEIAGQYTAIVILACNNEDQRPPDELVNKLGIPVYTTLGSSSTNNEKSDRRFQAVYPSSTAEACVRKTWE